LLKPLQECTDADLKFRIVCGYRQEYADAPHAVALLRSRGERPASNWPAEQRDELAPSHAGHGLSPSRSAAADHTSRRPPLAQSVCRTSSLPVEGAAGPWGRPESF
jgi:hypothetical protein